MAYCPITNLSALSFFTLYTTQDQRISHREAWGHCCMPGAGPAYFHGFFFFFEFGYRLFIKLWSIESDLVHWIKLWCKNRCSKNVRNKWKRLCFRTINNIICKYRSWRVFILPFFNSYIFKLLFLANRTIQIIRFQKY